MNKCMIWFSPCILLLFPLSAILASTEPNATTEDDIRGIPQQMFNNKSVSTLDSIKSVIEDSQNSGVLDRLAKCGATMQNMTEEQHQCVDNMAMSLESLK